MEIVPAVGSSRPAIRRRVDEGEIIYCANTLASPALEDLGQTIEDNLCHAGMVEE